MNREGRGARLVLYCMPLMENGVGSAWGLPALKESGGKYRSALALSEALDAPGRDGAALGAERLRKLEELGLGPLGRYLGGEPVRPLKLGAAEFFGFREPGEPPRFDSLAYGGPQWIAAGPAEELFRGHLEFLRRWGFSGGVEVEAAAAARLLGDYLGYLREETAGARVIVLVSRSFWKERLSPFLDRAGTGAKTGGDPGAGEIPVNTAAGGEAVWAPSFRGLGAALYEDLPPVLPQKSRWDIIIAVEDLVPAAASGSAAETSRRPGMEGRLTLTVTIVPAGRKAGQAGAKKEAAKTDTGEKAAGALSLKTYLFRSLLPSGGGSNPPPLPFPAARRKAEGSGGVLAFPRNRNFSGDEEEAAALGILPQWETGRVEAAGGALFAVLSKFSGIRAADYKEEQGWFYRDPPGTKQGKKGFAEPPPIKSGFTGPSAFTGSSGFAGLNETQREFFLFWRNQCRRGAPPLSASPYLETYIRLYAGELILCMGREGPLWHFIALRDLWRAYRESFPETGALLQRWCLDFAAIHGVAGEALPLLLEEGRDGILPEPEAGGREDTAPALFLDLAVRRFFVEGTVAEDPEQTWPLLRALIPKKILHRKEAAHDEAGAAAFRVNCCRTLAALDAHLRRDWNRGFFALFYPPRPVRGEFAAFRGLGLGESSYTAHWPDFSSHPPLIEILSALALDPETNPLPGAILRPRPLNMEEELIAELRQESDAVRDLLTIDEAAEPEKKRPGNAGHSPLRTLPAPTPDFTPPGKGNLSAAAFTKPDTAALGAFADSLGEAERRALNDIAAGVPSVLAAPAIPDMIIDAINEAFNRRFGDLLVETGPEGPSISAEYQAILREWESASPGG